MILQISWLIELPLQNLAVFCMGAGMFLIAFSIRRRGEVNTEHQHGFYINEIFIPTAGLIYAGGIVGLFLITVNRSRFIATIPLGLTGSIIMGGASALFYRKVYDVLILRQLPTTPGGFTQKLKVRLLLIGLIITVVGSVISYGIVSPELALPQTLLLGYTVFVFLSSSAGVTYRLILIKDEIADMALKTYAQYLLIIGIILITSGSSIAEFTTIGHDIYNVILSKIAYGLGFFLSVLMMKDQI